MNGHSVFRRGRGRGRGNGRGAWSNGAPGVKANNKTGGGSAGPGGLQSSNNINNSHARSVTSEEEIQQAQVQERFDAISIKHRESAQRYLRELQENNDFSDEEEEEEELKDVVLESIFKSYSVSYDEVGSNLVEKVQDDLVHSFRSATSACLVCIETVKKEEAIWCCRGCAGMFHITCIQKWVTEGTYQFNYKSDSNIPTSNIPWHCPKCRHEYQQSDCPTKYYCFCGKVADPPFDPWLVPHSCGQTCGRKLKPDCGHSCLLLCHPGPCPPCPKTIKSTCYCGKQPAEMKRCSARNWACGQPCGRILSCNQHYCQQPCHEGECSPCSKTSKQSCLCGRHEDTRLCASPEWRCKEVCNRPVDCGNHVCEKVCHGQDCGPCPRLGLRTCPCGKTELELPCTEDILPCGDTCEKLLSCGQHKCLERCHTGNCTPCQHLVVKRCKCGRKQKESLCSKEFSCDSKCNKQKNCGRHQCKKKCCKGNCPPCDQICGKPLGCKNHKCASPCHSGPCYPCPLTVDVFCFCKSTKVTVPCGKEKNAKKPKCNQICRIPPTCHHTSRFKHRCHFGDCPPCRLVCNLQLPGCKHTCPLKCHDEVKVKVIEKVERKGPWDPLPVEKIDIIKKPCPPCLVPLPQKCMGEHEIKEVECSNIGAYSCGRPCGRDLDCGNHTCHLDCHIVQDAPDHQSAGKNCAVCEELCLKTRPPGCTHSCPESCHPGPCPPCTYSIKMRCHCHSMVKHIQCIDWAGSSADVRANLKACGGRCPNNMPCGHRCLSPCHSGPCPEVKCQQLITSSCRCRRIKRQAICYDKKKFIECDEECERIKSEKRSKEEQAEKLRQEEIERKEREELEAFERKMKGKKRKHRKDYTEVIEPSWLSKNGKSLLISLLVAAFSVLFCYFVYTCIE
ncbi:hypothetical protein SNE40_016503 [Patella caerulea]|uniref:Uncharacterized protein n=1 Tax=Patella caerulea TaxID=87958 RepID=A0AAN8J8U6_PATCE